MSNDTDTSAPERDPSPEVPTPHRELVRPHDQRVIAGVASGLADYWGVSAGLVRVAFLVMSVFGGFGLLLYGGLWLIIPNDDGTESVLESAVRRARDGESWLGVVLITLAIVIGVSSLSWVDTSLAWAVALLVVGYLLYQGTPLFPSRPDRPEGTRPTHTEGAPSDTVRAASPPRPPRAPRPPRTPRPKKPRTILGRLTVATAFITIGILALADVGGAAILPHHYVGALLAVVAIALIVGAWFGRARWLILIGLLLLPAAAVTRVSDLNFDLTFGDLSQELIVVDSIEELDRTYTFDAADVTFDLSELPTTAQGDLQITVDVGEVTVLLPPDTQTFVDVEVGIGDITIGDQSSSGFGPNLATDFDGTNGPVTVRVDLGIGSVRASSAERN